MNCNFVKTFEFENKTYNLLRCSATPDIDGSWIAWYDSGFHVLDSSNMDVIVTDKQKAFLGAVQRAVAEEKIPKPQGATGGLYWRVEKRPGEK